MQGVADEEDFLDESELSGRPSSGGGGGGSAGGAVGSGSRTGGGGGSAGRRGAESAPEAGEGPRATLFVLQRSTRSRFANVQRQDNMRRKGWAEGFGYSGGRLADVARGCG